jgi:hypothetical protein
LPTAYLLAFSAILPHRIMFPLNLMMMTIADLAVLLNRLVLKCTKWIQKVSTDYSLVLSLMSAHTFPFARHSIAPYHAVLTHCRQIKHFAANIRRLKASTKLCETCVHPPSLPTSAAHQSTSNALYNPLSASTALAFRLLAAHPIALTSA